MKVSQRSETMGPDVEVPMCDVAVELLGDKPGGACSSKAGSVG